MVNSGLLSDPYNVIITGVGGQGNVMASRVLGNMLCLKGLSITIGETFGASQRGGPVMSHLRISSFSSISPQIPKGKAHMVVSLEPTEAIRVLKDYGNSQTMALCNTRPIHPVGVISGELGYPSLEDVQKWVSELTQAAWFIDATDAAMELGNPIFGNIMLIGALSEINVLPLDREDFKTVISQSMAADKVAVNLAAYDKGVDMVRK
jgi:indolepyruvate ferredoxin oxidoreductase beta subunit